MAADPRFVYRKLGYCTVKWNITNFTIATCRERCVISSSDFEITGEEKTRWRLNLSKQFTISGISRVTLSLERLQSSPGPDLVIAHYKFSLKNVKGNLIGLTPDESTHRFGVGFRAEYSGPVDMGSTNIIVEQLQSFEPDTLFVVCRIIVHVANFCNTIEKSTIIPGSLSHDFQDLFTRINGDNDLHKNIGSDTEFAVEGRIIKAHAVFLHARSEKFRKIMKEFSPTMNVQSSSYEVTKNVVSYLYSGNMDFVLRNPSIKLFENLEYLEVKHILNHYEPEKFALRTVIDVTDERFTWLIGGFKSCQEHCIESIVGEGISNTSWKLIFYPNGRGGDGKYVSISAECIKGTLPLDVCLDFAILNNNRKYFCLARIRKSMENRTVFQVDRLAERESLISTSNVLKDDSLSLFFRLRIATGQQKVSSAIPTTPFHTNIINRPYYTLSSDMEKLLRDDAFKNVGVFAGFRDHRYHKCILAARSNYFLREFVEKDLPQHSYDTPIDLKIFDIVMLYIYSGKLEHKTILGESIWNLSEVYDSAQNFGISNFNYDFVNLWKTNLEVKNACAVLLFADEKGIMELKNSALQFIVLNIENVRSHPSWDALAEAKPTLIYEITAFVGN